MSAKKKSARKTRGARAASERVALTLHSLRGIVDVPPKAYRAVCARGDFQGPKRTTRGAATQDALDHQDAHPSHKVEVLAAQ